MLHKLAEILSEAQNWSVNVFLNALNDFLEKIYFSTFPEKITPNIDFLTNFGQNFEFSTKFFQKSRKKIFSLENRLERSKTRLLTNFEV